MSHIYSEFEIGTELSINLRKSTELSFVTLTEKDGKTQVSIDTQGVSVGDYDLILESFNVLSIQKSTLKADTIRISVLE